MATPLEQEVARNKEDIIKLKLKIDELGDLEDLKGEVSFIVDAVRLLEERCAHLTGNKICAWLSRYSAQFLKYFFKFSGYFVMGIGAFAVFKMAFKFFSA